MNKQITHNHIRERVSFINGEHYKSSLKVTAVANSHDTEAEWEVAVFNDNGRRSITFIKGNGRTMYFLKGIEAAIND